MGGGQVLVLGASGLLGRAVLRELQAAAAEEGFGEVVGTACSRVGEGLVRLDASDHGAVVRLLEDLKPRWAKRPILACNQYIG